jgi:hypothetical protein
MESMPIKRSYTQISRENYGSLIVTASFALRCAFERTGTRRRDRIPELQGCFENDVPRRAFISL